MNKSGEEVTISVFRQTMRSNSEGFRQRVIQNSMKRVKAKSTNTIIYEPTLVDGETLFGSKFVNNLDEFKKLNEAVIANSNNKAKDNVQEKVYTRDII